MAHTYNVYRGRGVDFPEGALAYAIAIIWSEAAEAHSRNVTTHTELMNHLLEWRRIVYSSGVGMLCIDLDGRLAGNREKEDRFLEYIDVAKSRLRSIGETIPGAYLEKTVAVKGYNYSDMASVALIDVLDALRDLIRPGDTQSTKGP